MPEPHERLSAGVARAPRVLSVSSGGRGPTMRARRLFVLLAAAGSLVSPTFLVRPTIAFTVQQLQCKEHAKEDYLEDKDDVKVDYAEDKNHCLMTESTARHLCHLRCRVKFHECRREARDDYEDCR